MKYLPNDFKESHKIEWNVNFPKHFKQVSSFNWRVYKKYFKKTQLINVLGAIKKIHIFRQNSNKEINVQFFSFNKPKSPIFSKNYVSVIK